MNKNLSYIKRVVYDKLNPVLSDFKEEIESKEYDACRFKLNGNDIISRSAKITPKKVGQFVTFWKRNGDGPIEPFDQSDTIAFFVVQVRTENRFGQFVFPKNVLIQKGIISMQKKEGKRAFRVYSIWDNPESKQAKQTQQWQLHYFYEVNDSTDFESIAKLYGG